MRTQTESSTATSCGKGSSCAIGDSDSSVVLVESARSGDSSSATWSMASSRVMAGTLVRTVCKTVDAWGKSSSLLLFVRKRS
jgi:hypothetical protein